MMSGCRHSSHFKIMTFIILCLFISTQTVSTDTLSAVNPHKYSQETDSFSAQDLSPTSRVAPIVQLVPKEGEEGFDILDDTETTDG